MAISKAKKKKLQKKAAKAIFGKALTLIMLLIVLFGLLGACLYEYCEPFRAFIQELGIIKTEAPSITTINLKDNEMAVHFIDVGQGDSTLFQTSKGSILVDCGESEYGEVVVAYLKAQGIKELEYFIITHPDSDHMGCAAYVLQNIKVKTFVMNGQEKTANFFEKALDVIEEKEIPVDIVGPGDVINMGELQMKIYGPQPELVSSTDWNEASLIIHATYGERSFLLTGDAEKKGEEDLLKHYSEFIECDVFSAGHHGSKTSNSKELLLAANPTYVVISCGEGNEYGHPHQAALDVFGDIGAKIYRTDHLGSIVFITDGIELRKN